MTRPVPRLFDVPIQTFDEFIDGDTCSVWFWKSRYDLTWARVRTLAIDTPEKNEPGWLAAGDYVKTWIWERLALGHTFRMTTRKEDSFGRVLGDIYDATTGEHLDRAVYAFMQTYGIDITYSRELIS